MYERVRKGTSVSVTAERLSFAATPDCVGDVRHAASAFARANGADERTQQNVALAVSEAASNVVVHAYRDQDGPGEIHLELHLDGRDLWVVVSDRGMGISPRTDSPGLGLGMPLIANLAEHLEVGTPAEGGTEVRMRFGVRAACGA